MEPKPQLEYLGSRDFDKEFVEWEQKFYEMQLPIMMDLTEISYICSESIGELHWRCDLLNLWAPETKDEMAITLLTKFMHTKHNGVKTSCRMDFLRNKLMGKSGSVANKKWADEVNSLGSKPKMRIIT